MTDKRPREKTIEENKPFLLAGITFFVMGTAFLSSLFFDEVNPDRALLLLLVGLSFCISGTGLFFEGLALGYRVRFRRIFGNWPSQDECKKQLRKGVVGSKLSRKAGDLDNEFKRKNNYQGYLQTSEEELKKIIRERPPIDLSSLKEEEVALACINKQIADNRGTIKSLNKSLRVLKDAFWRAHKVVRYFSMTECEGKCYYKLHLFGVKFGT